MAYEFKLPDLGEGLTEGEIARWLVAEGQEIAEDDPLVEIQTDKTTVEIPSPAAGIVSRILVGEGEVVPVGTVLVVIGGDGALPRRPRPSEQPPGAASARRRRERCARRRSSAGSRRSSASISRPSSGTGPSGRITEDGRARAAGADGPGRSRPRGAASALRGVRRLIVEHMTRAHRESRRSRGSRSATSRDVDLKHARADGARRRPRRRCRSSRS